MSDRDLTQYEIEAAAQATHDIAVAMIQAAHKCLKLHGPDPTAPAILGAGFVLAIDKITEAVDPTFRVRILMQLSKKPP